MAYLIRLKEAPRLHETPLPRLMVEGNKVVLDVDDENEQRFRLIFTPYQAVRMTTADCFSPPEGTRIEPQAIYEVRDSPWIEELTQTLSHVDVTAHFMERASHFLVPLQDDFLEVVAWGIRWDQEVAIFSIPSRS